MFPFKPSVVSHTAFPRHAWKFFSHHWGAGDIDCSRIQIIFRVTVMFIPFRRKSVMPVLTVCASAYQSMVSDREKDEIFYTMTDVELIEDADLLHGETPPDPDYPCAEDIPVRLLDDFAIYDWDTLRLVPITELLRLKSGLRYGASGSVKPWADDSTDEDGNDVETKVTPLMLKLSPILELNVHHFSPATGSLDM